MERQFGVIKYLSKEYVKIKQRYNEIGEYNSSFNDSSSHGFMNDKGKVNLISKYDYKNSQIGIYLQNILNDMNIVKIYLKKQKLNVQ